PFFSLCAFLLSVPIGEIRGSILLRGPTCLLSAIIMTPQVLRERGRNGETTERRAGRSRRARPSHPCLSPADQAPFTPLRALPRLPGLGDAPGPFPNIPRCTSPGAASLGRWPDHPLRGPVRSRRRRPPASRFPAFGYSFRVGPRSVGLEAIPGVPLGA